MRNTWKKTAAFLLAFTLAAAPLSQTGVKGGLFGNIGIVAHADGSYTVDGVTFYKELGDVSELPTDEGNYYLTTDITITNYIEDFYDDINIYLNGHTITSNSAEWQGMLASVNDTTYGFYGTNQADEKIVLNQSEIAYVGCGALTLNGITVEGAGNSISDQRAVSLNGNDDCPATLTIKNSTIHNISCGVQIANGSILNMENSTISTVENGIAVDYFENSEYGEPDFNVSGTNTINGKIQFRGDKKINFASGATINGNAAISFIEGFNPTLPFVFTNGGSNVASGVFSSSVENTAIQKDTNNEWSVVSASTTETDISNATVNLGADNSVSSITVGDDTITDLSGFDITYGVSDTDHTATSVPTAAGTYYAYVTPKSGNETYTGTAKSDSFEVAAAPTMTNASVTLNDGFGLNFYVDNITDAADYTVMFDGACDENGTQVALTEKDGKFFATANVNAKDFKENIAATLYKDGVATDVTLTSSVDAYLTAALATDGLDDKTKAMVTSAQLYGLAADEYFNETDNNVATRIAAYMTAANINDTAINAALTPYAPTFTSDDAKVSMVLNSKIKLRVYSDNGASENGFGKYSEVAGLTPLTLAQPQAIDGFTVSGYTWVYRVLNNTASEAKDVNMAKALFAYMTAAKNLAVVDVASVTLDQSALTLTAGGDTATLTATVLPDNATDKTVTWSSDNEAVATVVDGVVTPIAKGTATITATSGGKSDTCTVTVKQLYSFTLTGPYTGETLVVEYYEGDTWNDMVAKYPNTLKVYSGYVAFGSDGFIYDERGDWLNATDQIDPNKTYEVE